MLTVMNKHKTAVARASLFGGDLGVSQAFYPYTIYHMEGILYGLRNFLRMETYSIHMEYKI
jgi:hypothetical protein